MSSARFARSGRLRICVLMSMFLVLIMMIIIYHMSQHQLDENRAFRVRCEQNQEGLNDQLQSLTDQKNAAEKNAELTLSEKAVLQQNYDTRLAEEARKRQELVHELSEKYDIQVSKYKQLESEHNELEAQFIKSKKKNLDDTNALDQKLQALLVELQKDKSAKEQEITSWKNKYNNLLKESEHKTHSLEATIIEFKSHCEYVPKVQPAEAPKAQPQQQLNKPAAQTSETARNSSPSPAQLVHSIEKPRNEKSFNIQEQIVPKSLKTPADNTETQLGQQQEEPVLAAVAAPISPLSAPHKPSSVSSSTAAAAVKAAGDAPSQRNASAAPKSSSLGLPPLAMPPPKPSERKLPDNVAPIPENYPNKPLKPSKRKLPENVAPIPDNKVDAADIDTAAEELPKNDDNKNNRYANVQQDLESGKALGVAPKPNEDSGAHEVKDFMNEQSFNLPAAAAENQFFDADMAAQAAGPANEADDKHMPGQGEAADDDDDPLGNMADVAVKPQNLLDANNLNNEIAGDQGKEFADGLHLDDGMEEDQDEDDYSNMAAGKQGDEVIRN